MKSKVVSFVLKYPDHKHFIGTRTLDERNWIYHELLHESPNLRVAKGYSHEFHGHLAKVETGELDVVLCHVVDLASGWKTDIANAAIVVVKQIGPSEHLQFRARLRGLNSRFGFFTGTSSDLIDEEVPYSPCVPVRKSMYHHD